MTKLNDIQLILLTGAAQSENGSLLPTAASVASAGDRLKRAITSLRRRGLVEEQPTTNAEAIWRTDDDDRIGLFITDAGRDAIHVEPDQAGSQDKAAVEAPAQSPKPKRQTKSAAVISLLQRPEGATLAELIEATGWQPHTTRAALTGLKKGFSIEKSKRRDVTCYHIVGKA